MLSTYVGRPSPLSTHRGFPKRSAPVYLKREDLNHTGAHKINNTVGQVLLARRMGKRRIIAETGAGQHGVATATVCARFGLECVVYMGEEDMRRQALNVFRMRLMGAEVVPVTERHANAEGRDERGDSRLGHERQRQHYIIGSVVGPGAVPPNGARLSVGHRRRGACADAGARRPSAAAVVACVGGGSNAMGIFHAFVADADVELIGVEAAGEGLESERHSASLPRGTSGRAARRVELSASGRGRAGASRAFHLGGPRLSGRRSRARLSSRTAAARRTSRSRDDEAHWPVSGC